MSIQRMVRHTIIADLHSSRHPIIDENHNEAHELSDNILIASGYLDNQQPHYQNTDEVWMADHLTIIL